MQHTFGFTGAAGGIKNKQRILGIHYFRLTFDTDIRRSHQFVIPFVSAGFHFNLGISTFHNNNILDVGT